MAWVICVCVIVSTNQISYQDQKLSDYVDVLVQDCSISNALAMETL